MAHTVTVRRSGNPIVLSRPRMRHIRILATRSCSFMDCTHIRGWRLSDLVQDREIDEARTDTNSRFEKALEPQRVILFVGAAGVISDRLMHALAREFPWVVIEMVDDGTAACRAFDHPVGLILVDAALFVSLEQVSPDLRRLHPHA